MVKTNRLVMGLIFPQLGSWEGFSQATPVEVILSDWERKEVEEMIEKLLGGKEGVEEYETANYSNATNSDAPDDEKFEIKTEGEAEIITISPNVMDEEDKDSTSYDDDAIKSDEENLKINIEAEGTENPNFRERWVCHICNRSFRFIEVLRKHAIGIHQTLKFLKCQYCDFETSVNRSLKRHENIHTKEVHFPCDECDKSFLDDRNLKVHKTSHSPGPVKCDLCEKSLKSTFRLRKHKSLMHREENQEIGQFHCEVCS